MSWFNGEGGASPPSTTGDGSPPPPPPQEQSRGPDLTGAPDFMKEPSVQSFWTPPEEGKETDWQGLAQRLAGAVKEGRTKIGQQGELLAKHTVPDSLAPYEEGLELDTLLKAHERTAYTPETAKQLLAQAHAAEIGPGPARTLLQAQVRSTHEAAPPVKDAATRRDEAIAALNATGRPGSEMAKRIQSVGGRLIAEGRVTQEQADAWADSLTSPERIEIAHAMVQMMAPGNPASGPTGTNGSAHLLEELQKKVDDPRFGSDHAYTQAVERELKQHEGLIATRWSAMEAPNSG